MYIDLRSVSQGSGSFADARSATSVDFGFETLWAGRPVISSDPNPVVVVVLRSATFKAGDVEPWISDRTIAGPAWIRNLPIAHFAASAFAEELH